MLNAPYSQLYGRMPAVAEVLADLGRLDLPHSIRALSRLLYVIFYDRPGVSSAQVDAARHWLGPETLRRLESYGSSGKPPVRVFYRQQILLAMKLLCLSHAQSGGLRPDTDVNARHLLGDALLKVVDWLPFGTEGHVSRDLISDPSGVLHTFNLSLMIENEAPAAWTLARHDLMLNRFVNQELAKKAGGMLGWDGPFARRHGVPIRDVALVSRVLFVWFWNHRKDPKYSGDHPWFDPDRFFANCVIERQRIDAALRHLSAAWDDMPRYAWLHTRGPLPTDVTMFLDKPLIHDPPGYEITDLTGLLGMSGDRLLVQIRDSIPVEERQDLFGGVLGRAFEAYVGWLLQNVYPNTHHLTARLEQQPWSGSSVLDYAISYGPVQILMEAKGILMPDHAVYGGDAWGFGTELYLRYAREDGIGQIGKCVSSIRTTNEADIPARVIPVLVVLDRTLSGFGVTSTLRKRLIEKLEPQQSSYGPPSRPDISPLVVLTVEDLECALGRVERGESLVDILDHVIANDDNGIQPARELIRSGAGPAPVVPECLWRELDDTCSRDAAELFAQQAVGLPAKESS